MRFLVLLCHLLPILSILQAGHASSQSTSQLVPLALETIRFAYWELGERINGALQLHMGDHTRLDEQRRSAMGLTSSIIQHRAIIPAAEVTVMEQGIRNMLDALDKAYHQSLDPPDGPLIQVSERLPGRRGRPKVEIEPEFLSVALDLRGPTGLANVFKCSARTVRRRALELGIAQPGPPVYADYNDTESGETFRFYTSSTGPVSDLSDEDLDVLMQHILITFPHFGRQMIMGHLRHLGHRVSQTRVYASYIRVHGAPPAFGSKPIQRRVYNVAGPNSLAHHDGQHGLIRYRIVIHAFVDGYSRYVTGIRASNNNRPDTVLDLFMDVVHEHGVPSRVRGDHGLENLGVAAWMEETRGLDRGSYIWGRSVHNIRIERLWRDVTHDFGQKWKTFFQGLEFGCGLNTDLDAHIWLLHHLFLPAINQDAQEWALTWNAHKIRLRHERPRSPRDLFLFGMVENGPRGLGQVIGPIDGDGEFEEDETIEDFSSYGIDWDELDDHRIRAHHSANNRPDGPADNPFVDCGPDHFSHVGVPEAPCPLTPEQVEYLDQELSQVPSYHSRNMAARREMWIHALAICRNFSSL